MNLMDQIQGEREVNNELKELLETLVEAVNLTEDQFILRTPAIEEEDDEHEYEDEEYEYDDEFAEDHEYIDLEPDVLRPPPLNPDYLATSQGQGTDMGTMTQSRHPLLERSNPPVPVNVIKSMPSFFASRRARGVAIIRPCLCLETEEGGATGSTSGWRDGS